MPPIERVAVIGAGPAGAITVDALSQERTFRVIRGFERREGPGGCWIGDSSPPPPLTAADVEALGAGTADGPVAVPVTLPATTTVSAAAGAAAQRPRFTESSVYPYLETNVDARAMEFSQEPFPAETSAWSVATHGADTPFRPWTAVRGYVAGLLARRGYDGVFAYGTTVERVEKEGAAWKLTLRRRREALDGGAADEWWAEWFDAVVVASGHYAVPYVPAIPGLAALAAARPGSVLHSKQYRGRQAFAGLRVVVVGASVSAADIAADLVGTAQTPVHVIVDGHAANGYFGDVAFDHPAMARHPSIARVDVDVSVDAAARAVVTLVDGTVLCDVDALIFGTGYAWTLPFLAPLRPAFPQAVRAAPRVPGLWQHVVWRHDPTLLFVGAVNAGLTFKIFEWQAVFAARLLAGRLAAPLPAPAAMAAWEDERLRARGDGPKFHLVNPDFEDYFTTLRRYAGPPTAVGVDGASVGRSLPPFDPEWLRVFMAGHERRKAMWRRNNAAAQAALAGAAEADKPRL